MHNETLTKDWVITFRNPLPPQQLQVLALLLQLLQQHNITDSLHQICWNAGSSTTFTLNSQYRLLQRVQPDHQVDRAARAFRRAVVPSKIKITMWLVVLGKLPAEDYLYRRRIRPLSPCILCGSPPETFDYIFLACPFCCAILGTIHRIAESPLLAKSSVTCGKNGGWSLFPIPLEGLGIFHLVRWSSPYGWNVTLGSLTPRSIRRPKFTIEPCSLGIYGGLPLLGINSILVFCFLFSILYWFHSSAW